jgi:hypothetical protein
VDCAINPASTEKSGICRIDDRVDLDTCDVAGREADACLEFRGKEL